jgi:hypothetical protein
MKRMFNARPDLRFDLFQGLRQLKVLSASCRPSRHICLSRRSFSRTIEQVSSWPGGNAEFAPEPLASGPTWHTVVYEPGRIRLEFDFDPRV